MAKDLELKLRITADGKVAVQQLRQIADSTEAVGDAGTKASGGLQNITTGLQNLTNGLLSLHFGKDLISDLNRKFGELVTMADGFGQLKARIANAVEGFGDAGRAMEDVSRIANTLGVPLAEVGDLYVKLSGSAKNLGLDQAGVAETTEVFGKALVVSGASGAQASSALTQFAQAMATGTLRGEEFNAVYEAAPYIIDQIAKGMDVATKDMRDLAEAGALSAAEVSAALRAQSEAVDDAWGKMPRTVEQSLTLASNAMTVYLGETNASLGATETLAAAIGGLAEHMDLIGAAAGALAAGGLAKMTQAGAASVKQTLLSISAWREQHAQMAATTAAAKGRAEQEASLAAKRAAWRAADQASLAKQALAEQAAAAAAQKSAQGQLAAMGELSIFGERRAAAERNLAAAITLRQAADAKAATTAQLAASAQVAASTATASAGTAAAGTAAGVGLMSRAFGVLAGPVGILLTVVGSFAALALAQGDTADSMDDLTAAIERQRQGLEKLGAAGLAEAIRQQEAMTAELRKEIAVGREHLAHLDERMDYIRRVRGETEGLANLDRDRSAAAADLEQKERLLADAEDLLTDARARQATVTGQALSIDVERRLSAVAMLQALAKEREAVDAAAKAQELYYQVAAKQAKTSADAATARGDMVAALQAEERANLAAVGAARAAAEAAAVLLEQKRRELQLLRDKGPVAAKEAAEAEREAALLRQQAEARKVDLEAAEQSLEAARLQVATYGDQSTALAGLLAQQSALRSAAAEANAAMRDGALAAKDHEQALLAARTAAEALTAGLIAGAGNVGELQAAATKAQGALAQIEQRMASGAVSAGNLAAAERDLAALGPLIADAARDAAAWIDLEVASNERALTIAQARLALETDQTNRLIQLAKARGDDAEALRLSTEAHYADAEATRLASEAKAADAAALAEKARFLEIAGRATGGYTREEQALAEATRQAAEMAGIEAQRLGVAADMQRTAARAARDLVEQNILLDRAFVDAGVAGVRSMEDVRSAIASAGSGPELQALGAGLEAAIQAGVDKAGDLSKALADVRGKIDDLNSLDGKKFSYAGSPAALAQRFKPGEEDKIKEELGRMWDYGKGGTGDFGKFLQEVVLLVQAEWKKKDDERRPASDTVRAAPDSPAPAKAYRRVVDINLRGVGETATVTAASEDDAERVIRVLRAAQRGAT